MRRRCSPRARDGGRRGCVPGGPAGVTTSRTIHPNVMIPKNTGASCWDPGRFTCGPITSVWASTEWTVARAPPAGFEPATVGLEVRCSIQLSYGGQALTVPAGPSDRMSGRVSDSGRRDCSSMILASHGGRSSARLERQVVALEVGGSSPLGHPESPAADGGFLPDAAGSLSSVLRDGPGRHGDLRL